VVPHVVTIPTPQLGDRSYLLHDGRVALVVDPQRDLPRVREVASTAGVRIACVAETHVHNDYVTGGLELARALGVPYLLNGSEQVEYERRAVGDGDVVDLGGMRVSVLATPGHTPGHLSYLVEGGGGEDAAVCSGGSMLFGTVGRTDLLGAALADELSRAQHRSVRRLAHELAPATAVLPTHGFGSFCSSSPPSGAEATTIAIQREENLALRIADEDAFVDTLLAGFGAYPAYYAEMAPINRAGPPPWPAAPADRLDPDRLARHLHSGGWVVDLRRRREFAAAHLAGSVGFEHTQPFTTYLGWVVPSAAPLVLIGDSAEMVEAARRDLTRIGRDGPCAGWPGGVTELSISCGIGLEGYEVLDFAGLAAVLDQGAKGTVLDVRQLDEWEAGHIAGATHLFVGDLLDGLGILPAGRLFVHCASGYRASVAAGLLQRHGREVVLVDDEWDNALSSGLPIEPEPGA
jgi:glyoxylase-like metal-dependent hydrolase (beta-lactamase superfamily II)/rhodanese-related sulfurtransferase